ncbi:MAG: lytic transglycosylase domain-containing protein [Ferruginibacter sp.]
MKQFAIIFFIIIAVTILPAAGKNIFAQIVTTGINTDTSSEDLGKEDAMIEEVLKTRTLPKKEKVQYFSQVTKYGFKNLFSNYSYNSSIPYAAQINPNAEGFIQDYMRHHSKYLNDMKSWGKPYFNLIETVLQQYGLPKELKYIAVIESNLKTSATSQVGAGGPWQFMPYTARQYGLVVNQYNDDRRDYYKSTHAAARYLLSLYKDMHDWLLVMAAYNGGPGRVYSAIKKSGSRNFWSLQYHLPEESRTYVKRFIATHYIMEGGAGITTIGGNTGNFDNAYTRTGNASTSLPDSILADVEMLPLSGKYNSVIIAKNLSMDIALFNQLNPDFDLLMSSEGNFELRLPPDKMQLFVANKYQILNECIQVMLGETSMPVNKTVYPKSKKKKS